MLDEQGFAGTVPGIQPRRACAANATGFTAVTRQVSTDTYLVADIDVSHAVAHVLVIRKQVIVRQLRHIERLPRILISCFHIARKNTIPEIHFVQQVIARVIAPDDAHVQHVEMVIRQQVNATVIMMSKGNDRAIEIVVVLGFNPLRYILVVRVERRFAGCCLHRFVENLRHVFNISWQIVSIPERHEQPNKTRSDNNVAYFHRPGALMTKQQSV